MEFNSLVFVFLFLPIVFALYTVLRTTAGRNILLVGASVVFYCWVVVWYFVPLLISSVLDYVIGQKIHGSDDDRFRKRLVIISVVVNLSLMSFFKYTGWLTGEIAAALALIGVSFSQVSVALPPGVSFYTFQTMSYTLDIYRRDFKPTGGFLSYLSFVSFFPQLVAGPIERARDLLPQVAAERPSVTPELVASALFLVLWGLFLKVAIADNFGGIVDLVLRELTADSTSLPAGMGLVFAYAFAFQIYCDFSAYSIIARGVARLFSIELSRNFLTPYFATSPSEFWQRWHITLSQWLRDYLYIPLGGNQGGRWLTARNLIITMALGGLWHGAGILFIVWGLYHGLLLVLYRFVPIDTFLQARLGWLGKVLAIVVFFHFVCLGWIFFRASPDQLAAIFGSILAIPAAVHDAYLAAAQSITPRDGIGHMATLAKASLGNFLAANWLFSVYCWGIVLFGSAVWVTDYLGWRNDCEFVDLYDRMPMLVKVAVIYVTLYGIIFFGRREANEFIYFQF